MTTFRVLETLHEDWMRIGRQSWAHSVIVHYERDGETNMHLIHAVGNDRDDALYNAQREYDRWLKKEMQS